MKLEMLEGPSVGADRIKKFKYNQVTKMIYPEEPNPQKKKKEEKEKPFKLAEFFVRHDEKDE